MKRSFAVYVDSLGRKALGGVEVAATNGGRGGPPSLSFEVDGLEAEHMRIGQQLTLTVEWT